MSWSLEVKKLLFVASSREQFYVLCSRGKETIHIYTDNRRGLQEAVGNSSTRMAGVELAELNQKEISSMSTELGSKQWRDAIQSRRGLDESKFWVKAVANQRQQDPLKKGTGANWKGYIEMRRNLAGPDGKSRSKGHPMSKKKGGQPRGRTLPKTNLHTAPLFAEKMTALHEKAKKAAEEKILDAPDKDKALPEKPTEGRKVEQSAKPVQEPRKGATDSKQQQASLKQQAAIEAPKFGEKKRSPEQQKAAPQQSNTRKNWASNMYQSATNHFNKVADKVKGQGKDAQAGKTQGQVASQTLQNKQGQGTQRQVNMGNTQVKPLQQNNMPQVANHAAKQKPIDAGAAAQKQAALQNTGTTIATTTTGTKEVSFMGQDQIDKILEQKRQKLKSLLMVRCNQKRTSSSQFWSVRRCRSISLSCNSATGCKPASATLI